jgi:hypothetical protein
MLDTTVIALPDRGPTSDRRRFDLAVRSRSTTTTKRVKTEDQSVPLELPAT